ASGSFPLANVTWTWTSPTWFGTSSPVTVTEPPCRAAFGVEPPSTLPDDDPGRAEWPGAATPSDAGPPPARSGAESGVLKLNSRTRPSEVATRATTPRGGIGLRRGGDGVARDLIGTRTF